MTARSRAKPSEIHDRLIAAIRRRIAQGKPVRRRLPDGGRLHLDRPLPFLCVYRRPPRRPDPGTQRLVTTEASYLLASGAAKRRGEVLRLLEGVVEELVRSTGACLVLEVWSGEHRDADASSESFARPAFRIHAPPRVELGSVLDRVEAALSRVVVRGVRSHVEIVPRAHGRPGPLLSRSRVRKLGCTVLGIEVRPVYQDSPSGTIYPAVLRELRRALSLALERTVFEFARTRSTFAGAHYHTLGRRMVLKAMRQVDQRLADVADSFELLLSVTPVNTGPALRDFERSRWQRAPVFHYRPLPVDPVLLKRKLFAVPVERVEDPALAMIAREKMDELDRQITLLADLDSPRFLHGSIQLYGVPDEDLLTLARALLARVPPRSREPTRNGRVDASGFARLAREEIDRYRRAFPDFSAEVEVRADVGRGLMVSGGRLLVGTGTSIPKARADALLQHEVGTHLVTYYNGRAQPFRQLYSGLAGYEALQEGLAVLAEYLVGGLSRPRLRLLAARVVAVQHMVDGAEFIETFRKLTKDYGFARQTAFTMTMRIYRGGGLTKDAVYLRGFRDVLAYLRTRGKLEPLYVGKIAAEHVSIVNELRWRGVLRPPPLKPRFLERPDALARLSGLREGVNILTLAGRRAP